MRAAWRIARRELRGGLGGFRVFLACLALGVAAIAAVGSAGRSIEAGLEREGAALLGGDAEMTFTYRFADGDERAWMEGAAEQVSEIAEFRSMASVGEDRALTQIRAVDAAWPLVGEVVLDPPIPLAEALAGDGVVAERALTDRLGIAPGDAVRLGEKTFTLRAVLERVPDGITAGFSLGPRTVVQRDALEGSGLLAPGTLFDSSYRLVLPEGADIAALEEEADALFRDAGVRWRDAREGAPGISEVVGRLESFLVLVGLAGLSVGGVGVAAAVRAYLARKRSVIATLRTLGAERRTVFAAYFMQIGVLTAVGVAIGLVLGAALPLAVEPLIADTLPVPAEIRVWPGPLAEAALYGVLAAFLFTLGPLARIEEIRPAALFRDGGMDGGLPRWPYLAVLSGLAALLVGSAAWLSGLPILTLWTAGGIAAALLVLAGAAWLIRRAAGRAASSRAVRGRTPLRLALGAVGGPRSEALPVVLSLGLGLTVLAAIGQIDWNLRTGIERDLPEVAPSFFLVDIQPDQIEPFLARARATPGVTEVESAPMLRGVITCINGAPAEEVAGEHWVLQGDRGVTYAARPAEDDVITEGAWWPEDYAGPNLVSFSAEEGEEMGLSVGDVVTVNILGRDIEAQIANFRAVEFETAGIGFIMSMNPGALQGAPHTHIATVYAEREAEGAFLRWAAAEFPNVTAIAVRDAIARVAEVLEGIGTAIRYAALATLVTGFVVLIGAAAAGEGARVFEAAVLKTLGATRAAILRSFALRAALLGAAAGIVALAAGCLAAWGALTYAMEADYELAVGNALAVVLGGIAATLVAGLAFAWRPLAARPARVLRARE